MKIENIQRGALINGSQLIELLSAGNYRIFIMYKGETYTLDNIPMDPHIRDIFTANQLFIRGVDGFCELDNLNNWIFLTYYRTQSCYPTKSRKMLYEEYLETNKTFSVFVKPI